MKITKVQYTVRAEFAEQNQKNISAVMSELREVGNSDLKYAAYRFEDGKTFMHLVHFKSDDVDGLPSRLDSFKRFQKELKENIEVPPKVENLNLADSSFDVF